MRRERIGWALIAVWIAIVTAFAVNFDLAARIDFRLNDVPVIQSIWHLFLALFGIATAFNLLLVGLVALARRSGTLKKFVFILLGASAVGLFALLIRIAVDFQFIFNADELTGGVIAVLIFLAGLVMLVVARLIQVVATRTG